MLTLNCNGGSFLMDNINAPNAPSLIVYIYLSGSEHTFFPITLAARENGEEAKYVPA